MKMGGMALGPSGICFLVSQNLVSILHGTALMIISTTHGRFLFSCCFDRWTRITCV